VINRRLIAVAVVLAALAAPVPAMAGSVLCPASRACIYDHTNFVGLLNSRVGGGGLSNVPGAYNDMVTSWENKSVSDGAWYFSSDGRGTCRTMLKHYEFHYVGAGDNDNLTSWRLNGRC
jgi:hypothetical protein